MASSIGNSRIYNSPYLALNWKQTAKDQGWSAALSIGTKDKQSTIASFSAHLTGKDVIMNNQNKRKSEFWVELRLVLQQATYLILRYS